MRIIFLDIDGVLNNTSSWNRGHRHGVVRGIDPANVKALNHLMGKALETFKELPKIVVSSTWRYTTKLEDLKVLLTAAGFKHSDQVIDITGTIRGDVRGLEIQQWLTEHAPIDSILILDDSTDMVHLMRKLLRTSDRFGLQDKHAWKAMKILGQPLLDKVVTQVCLEMAAMTKRISVEEIFDNHLHSCKEIK